MKLQDALQILRKHKSFLVTTHANPDPDALSSELAVAAFLRSLGKTIVPATIYLKWEVDELPRSHKVSTGNLPLLDGWRKDSDAPPSA